MGLIRILLAIAVFCGHSRPLGNLSWLGGDLAVELFFVISGFYMQLVLSARYTNEKLGETWISQFYKARYLRLLPIYLTGSVLAVGAALLKQGLPPLSTWSVIFALPNSFANSLFKVFLSFTNLSMFFQDVTMFLSVQSEQVQWSANYRDTDVELWQGLAVPPAWSLGIEISFYLLAPFLLNLRSQWLLLGIFCCLTSKVIIIKALDLGDPWTYRFFPFEMGYFLLGSLAFRYQNWLTKFIPERSTKYLAYPFAVGLVAFALPLPHSTLVYPTILACVLPSMFRATSRLKIDRYIGELSYPFYIFHYFAILVGNSINRHIVHGPENMAAWLGLVVTFVLATIVLALEIRFIEPRRAQFAERQSERKPSLTEMSRS